jgi:hypothetical protein
VVNVSPGIEGAVCGVEGDGFGGGFAGSLFGDGGSNGQTGGVGFVGIGEGCFGLAGCGDDSVGGIGAVVLTLGRSSRHR